MARATGNLRPTDMVEAAKSGDRMTLEEILEKFPSQVDIEVRGVTAMHMAAFHGETEVMKLLIRYHADINCSASDDSTPLHYAVKGNQPEAVELLLQNGAKVDEENDDSLTPPQLSYQMKLRECNQIFQTFNPSIVFKPTQQSMTSQLVENPSDVETDDRMEEEENSESVPHEKDDSEKCIFCAKNAAIVTFKPCGHKCSCFECSLPEVCKCGEPIEDRSFDDNKQILDYIKEIEHLRISNNQNQFTIDELKKKYDKLEESITCSICNNEKLMCSLKCGHMFCIPCVKKMKDQNFSGGGAKCPQRCTETPSRYLVLRADWLKK